MIGAIVAGNLSLTNPAKPVVTGGTLYSDATYYYRVFTANGTFGLSNTSLNTDIIVIAGGGGGGTGGASTDIGGGGGAGGILGFASQSISPSSVSVQVGGGGATDSVGIN